MRTLIAFLSFVLLLVPAPAPAQFVNSGPVYNGTRAVVDLPVSQHMRNVGGSDGYGLCVFTSLQHSARWQGVYSIEGYRRYMESRPGGGYPSKVDATLKAFCQSKGITVPDYIQHTGGDDGFLDLAIRTGRCPSVTYGGKDGFYRSGVYHMVNLAHIDADSAAIIDNNRPGVWVWMSRRDFLFRWRDMDGGWAVVLLGPPPPPYAAVPAAAVCRCDPCECGECRCGPRFSQCSGGQCAVPAKPAAADGWHEVRFRDGEVIYKLYRGGRLIGVQAADGWRPAIGDGWEITPRGQAPEPVPAQTAGDVPTGVVPGRVHDSPSYSLSGRPCSRDEALSRLGGLADDSDRWNLSIVGSPELIGRVRSDVSAMPATVRDRLHVLALAPDVWQVSTLRLGLGVTLRRPAVHRVGSEVGFVPGVEYSADRLAALLAMPGGPTHHPAPTPEPKPNDPAPSPGPDPKPVPVPNKWPELLGWIVLLSGVLYLLLRKR